MVNRVVLCGSLACVLLVVANGCSQGEKLPTVPAGGVVKYKGAPLPDALVSFLAVDPQQGRSASGTTDSSGRYQLKTFLSGGKQADGAIPGSYKVSIRKYEAPANAPGGTEGNMVAPTLPEPDAGAKPKPAPSQMQAPPNSPAGGPPASGMAGMLGGGPLQGKSAIPEKYENPDLSGFTATVQASGNEPFNFDLTDE